jgi:hypothetical protein
MESKDELAPVSHRFDYIGILVLLISFSVVAVFAFLNNLLWAVAAGLVYVLAFPLIFLVDYKTKRNVLAIYAVQIFFFFIILYVFITFQAIYGSPVLYWDIYVFAFTMFFAGGVLAIFLYRIYRPLLVKRALEAEKEGIDL